MSKTYAFVKPETGEISYTSTVKSTEDYPDGTVMGNFVMYDISSFGPSDTFMSTKYYSEGQWLDKPQRPSKFHDWTTSGWVFNSENFWIKVRYERDLLLRQSDWSQMPDVPLTETQKTEWQTYRQALRDVPLNNSNVTSLDEVVWPTPPTV